MAHKVLIDPATRINSFIEQSPTVDEYITTAVLGYSVISNRMIELLAVIMYMYNCIHVAN